MATVEGAAARLEDWWKVSPSPVFRDIVYALYTETQSVLKDIHFTENASLQKMVGLRITAAGLPTSLTYGKLNDTPARRRTTALHHEEPKFMIRDNVFVDVRYQGDKKAYEKILKINTKGLFIARTRGIDWDFFNNDPSAAGGLDGGPTGLFTRLSTSANRDKWGHADECNIDGSNLLMTTSAVKANDLQLFETVDQALQFTKSPEGTNSVIYGNDRFCRRFATSAKRADNGSGLKTTEDNYHRSVSMYKNARIREVGRAADDVTRIIGNTENTAGTSLTGGDRTSFYVVHYGEGHLEGEHDGSLDLKKVGLDDTGTQDVYLLDYLFGMFHSHDRTVARVFGIQM